MKKRFSFPLILLAFLAGSFLAAQSRRLTLEEIYHPEQRRDFDGQLPRLQWLPSENAWLQWERAPREWWRVEAESGERRLFLRARDVERAARQLPGFTAEKAAQLAETLDDLRLSTRQDALLIAFQGDLYLYDLPQGILRRLTFSPQSREELAEFSPDGRMISFVRDFNLWVVEVETARERALTSDGHHLLLNGKLDWVYQEEIYGRGDFKAYWWSPDSSRLAYLQLDESQVPAFTVVDHIPLHLGIEVERYPKAGDPNPRARLGVVEATGGDTTWVDLQAYQGLEFLLVRVGWTPDSSRVVFQVQDRIQTFLDLLLADPADGSSRRLLRETSPAWVNRGEEPYWLPDGSFLWLSERTGWKHLYHYNPEGELLGTLTQGEWEVQELQGVDSQGFVYFTGTQHSPLGRDVYRVSLKGGEPQRLSDRDGTHSARFSSDLSFYLDTWSSVTTPPQLRLHRADGSLVRTVEENEVPLLKEYQLGRVQFVQVNTRDGFPMEAMLIYPPDFDPSRRYPVVSYTYSGPHAPQVRNRWGGSTFLWHQMLAQQGYLIWICDNRTASGKGARSTWPLYKNFGELELQDLEDGLTWLKKQPWVDPDRIALWGWSFGGYMTAYALTHSRSFKLGIAGAPVTDWRLYDSIYTERYMDTPQNNPQGYRKSSVLEAAGDLHGKLLLLHGSMDDNVHLQNTLRLAYELQKEGKAFQMMIYPRSRHGIREPRLVYHLRRLMTDFIRENL